MQHRTSVALLLSAQSINCWPKRKDLVALKLVTKDFLELKSNGINLRKLKSEFTIMAFDSLGVGSARANCMHFNQYKEVLF